MRGVDQAGLEQGRVVDEDTARREGVADVLDGATMALEVGQDGFQRIDVGVLVLAQPAQVDGFRRRLLTPVAPIVELQCREEADEDHQQFRREGRSPRPAGMLHECFPLRSGKAG